ncbi:MAG: protein kinase [Sandaracinaceae bacterium]|nr:protein kinase [Sandaracinaceae bacterium]
MSVGATIGGRFLLRAIAGKGGMGTVYRADDLAHGGAVALKLLDGDEAIDVARFDREARVLDTLRHPNIVRYVDHGHTTDGHAYLAMEWLDGSPLDAWLASRSPSVEDALSVLRAAAAGLGAAHAAGIVHRDVKPANLFLVQGDPRDVKVIDFGIARGVSGGNTLTQSGTVVGTPFYMAPEQARARGGVTAACDVYALGAVLYQMLSGRPPFSSDNLMAVLAAILMEVPLDVRARATREIPDAVADLTMELLSKDPADRPADGAALGARLVELGAPQPGRRTLAPALTEREQRVLCLVLAAGQADVLAHAATLRQGNDDVMGRVRAAVEAHGGKPEVLADGSLVARMDGPGTPTDQAVHAAHCAVALREIAPDLPLAVVAGRGHFQGPIPVGEVIERGSALLGRAVAGALTIRQGELGGPLAAPGRLPVRIDDVMAGLLEGRFEVLSRAHGDELGEEIRSPTTARNLRGRRTPCVGRRRELATLTALYEECAEEPIARAALITGAAGLGKSRLLTELLEKIEQSDEPPTVWHARGDPVAPGSPFGLVAQLVRYACDVREGEPLAERRLKLLRGIGAVIAGPEGQRVALHLGELARIPLEDGPRSIAPDDPKLRGDAMRDAFLTWLDAATRAGPLVLALDDLQWGDRPSLSFVDAALRELATAPLLVLGAGRPELTERFGELWSERDAQPLRLARLRPKAAEEIVSHGLGAADPELAARLVERADGNPFFLEELVRAIADGEGEEGLPTTVLGMVESRLAVLESPTRRVLRAASVFGRRFWRGGVIELLGGAARAGDVDAHLDVLTRRDLVDRHEPSRFSGEQELGFRHALTREASHATLTDDDRRLGHRLAGAWLEAAGETDALVLAEHYARGGDDAHAATWWALAAEQALEGGELADAVARAERALVGVSDAARGATLVTLADAYRWRGDYGDAFARAVDAAGALEAGTRSWFRALGVLFAAAGRLRRHEEAEAWRRVVMDTTASPDAAGAHVVALCRAATLALAEGEAGRYEATMALAERLAKERAPDDALARAWISTLRASEALRAGDHGAFVDGTEEAARSYEAGGDLRNACNQRVRLGNGYVGLGDAIRAIDVLLDALGAARRMGLRVVEGYALQNLGHALTCAGRAEEAREVEERALLVARALDDAVLEAGCLLYRSEARADVNVAGAIADAQRAVELLEAIPGFRAVAKATLSRALLAAGRVDDALAAAIEAATEASGASLEEGEALIYRAHVEALLAAGQEAQARRLAEGAVARLHERAGRITDGGWRDSFLHRVPDHARLLELGA